MALCVALPLLSIWGPWIYVFIDEGPGSPGESLLEGLLAFLGHPLVGALVGLHRFDLDPGFVDALFSNSGTVKVVGRMVSLLLFAVSVCVISRGRRWMIGTPVVNLATQVFGMAGAAV